jgi:hypothetical protein
MLGKLPFQGWMKACLLNRIDYVPIQMGSHQSNLVAVKGGGKGQG